MDNNSDLAISRISECGMLIDHFFEIYDKLQERGFEKRDSLLTAKELINSLILYKAGLVIDQESTEVLEAD